SHPLSYRQPHTGHMCWIDPLTGGIGWDAGFSSKGFDGRNLPVLSSYLEKFYGPDYEVVVYQAAQFAISNPVVRIVKIKDLAPGERSRRLNALRSAFAACSYR